MTTPKPQMKDVSYAARHRDIITRIARSVVDQMRPEVRIGKVFDYDTSTRKAQILFAGETVDTLVSVSFGSNMSPTNRMADEFDTLGYDAPADVVRVTGRTGRYYIDSFISGEAMNYRYETAIIPIGGVITWPVHTPPKFGLDYFAVDRFLPCDARMLNIEDYPNLFAVLGTTYGGDGVTTFQLPLWYSGGPDITLQLADNWIVASAGWSITVATYVRHEGVATINISGTRTGADIVAPASGDISNSEIGTITDSRMRPRTQCFMVSQGTGRVLTGYITGAGSTGISATVPNTTISTGDSWSFSTTYVTQPNTDSIKMIRVA